MKYCNAPDKIGNITKERYDSYLRSYAYKDIFKDFYFYNNEFDQNDKQNTIVKKFNNPHETSYNNLISLADELGNEVDSVKEINCFDHSSKNRMISSSSTSVIFKHNRVNSLVNYGINFASSTNSTNHKRSYSTCNFKI